MSYQVLARKWRPKTFQDMVGQEHVRRMLTNALDHQRLHHAYLFTGTRGVGKTTVARLFAKCLNCETGISSNPCGQCGICQAVDAGRFLDLMEIDAASRTKVEDTRELLDNVHYMPTQGRFKVYLIDEIHMLSGHSFNALLKTLEEPPAHVKFLLATTDPKRLPITILSRCLQFNLKRVSPENIANHLEFICQAEKIEFEIDALHKIAIAADGSLRDALSLLDQAIAFSKDTITLKDTSQMLGHIEQDHLLRLLTALAQADGNQLFQVIQQLAEQAPDYTQILSDLLSLLHQIARVQIVPDLPSSPPVMQLAQQFSAEDTQLYYQIALIGKRDLLLAPNPAHGFEMLMLRMLAFKPAIAEQSPALKEQPAPKTMTPAVTQTTLTWSELLIKLQLTGMTQALASNCTLIKMLPNQIELGLSPQHQPMLNPRSIERIEQALTQCLGQPTKLTITLINEDLATPAKDHQNRLAHQKAQATEAIKNDSHVQKILDVFNASLDINTIKTRPAE